MNQQLIEGIIRDEIWEHSFERLRENGQMRSIFAQSVSELLRDHLKTEIATLNENYLKDIIRGTLIKTFRVWHKSSYRTVDSTAETAINHMAKNMSEQIIELLSIPLHRAIEWSSPMKLTSEVNL